jgi:hypothetical protein
MVQRLRELIKDAYPVRYIGRAERSSPAEGSLDQHNEEQAAIVAAAFAEQVAGGVESVNGKAPAEEAGRSRKRAAAVAD